MKKRWIYVGVLAIIIFIIVLFIIRPREETPVPRFAATPAPEEAITQAPTATPTPSPAPPPAKAPEIYEGAFELPINGATGYASIALNVREGPDAASQRLGEFAPGDGFRIVREDGAWWYVTDGEISGYVNHRYCMINLPDVIPSIVYDNTNSYGALLRSSGKDIPGVTGKGLYDNLFYNPRLGRNEFIMPVLYQMAVKLQAAQRAALKNGESLKLYEAYRPYAAQMKVVEALAELAKTDAGVMAGISTHPWSAGWFAAQKLSHHQRGCAVDVSLVKVTGTQTRACGGYAYVEVTGFSEYEMPTRIHELSYAAAAFEKPVSSANDTAWRRAAPAASMNDAAKRLQKYCTGAGLTPLASEWWHFNDLAAYGRVKGNSGKGGFTITEVFSREANDD